MYYLAIISALGGPQQKPQEVSRGAPQLHLCLLNSVPVTVCICLYSELTSYQENVCVFNVNFFRRSVK